VNEPGELRRDRRWRAAGCIDHRQGTRPVLAPATHGILNTIRLDVPVEPGPARVRAPGLSWHLTRCSRHHLSLVQAFQIGVFASADHLELIPGSGEDALLDRMQHLYPAVGDRRVQLVDEVACSAVAVIGELPDFGY
jgi:hypothetical protein